MRSAAPPRSVQLAIAAADRVLRRKTKPRSTRDPRWQAVIAVGAFIETNPDEVWRFALHLGMHASEDVRTAVETCLVEHLLEHDFQRIFPRLKAVAHRSPRMADVASRCWALGAASQPQNARMLARLGRLA